jgi:hypothetical protein
VNNPVRRKLHENFIRQNLDNFTNEANVIQFTSAEFTGPLAFEQFWLDTIGDWEREHSGAGILPANRSMTNTDRLEARPTKPLIALAATKDVQDGILEDAKRAAVVDVICFRYWWQTDKGLFAPKGGQNLSPRQFERKWKGGSPTEENLAQMAAEYRGKFPDKAIIASGEDANLRGSWAFLCAGGSMPDLPKTTDKNLLAAIPQMKPWAEASKNGRWILRETGKQFLIYSSRESELDLSGETGAFRMNLINSRTGEVTRGEMIKAGEKIKLPNAQVIWLTKEN